MSIQVTPSYDGRSPFELAGVEPTQWGGPKRAGRPYGFTVAFRPNNVWLSKALYGYLRRDGRPRRFRPVGVRWLRTRIHGAR